MMFRWHPILTTAITAAIALGGLELPALPVASLARAADAKPAAGTVELDVITQKGVAIDSQQEWVRVLGGAGFSSVRLRNGKSGDVASLAVQGSETAPVYQVTGVLTSDGSLTLPGARFNVQQGRRIADYAKRLAERGPASEKKTKPAPFGLSDEQFAAVKLELGHAVSMQTKGMPIADAVAKIAAPLKYPVVFDGTSKATLGASDVVLDELAGVSSGTALAAALRPAGLVLAPRRIRGEIELAVVTSRGATELWPIGWAPKEAIAKVIPDLVKVKNVEIEDTALVDAVSAIAKQLAATPLYDYNNMARLDIDLAKAKTSLPSERLIYASALRKVLYPSRLKYEVRVDEQGKPLLWITTLP
jgi:hypothetical protein